MFDQTFDQTKHMLSLEFVSYNYSFAYRVTFMMISLTQTFFKLTKLLIKRLTKLFTKLLQRTNKLALSNTDQPMCPRPVPPSPAQPLHRSLLRRSPRCTSP